MHIHPITQAQYEYALARIEELLPQVGEDTPANDRKAVELALISDVVIDYEKAHFPIAKTHDSRTHRPLARREAHDAEAVVR